MIVIGNTLVSEDIFDIKFVCDLQACKGACCVDGESGAPLEAEEVKHLEDNWEWAKEYLTPEHIQVVEENGFSVLDEDQDLTTPLYGKHGACAFVYYEQDGTAKCAYEKAYLDGKTTWKKPISCHLYPIRLTKLKEYTGVNYHHWPICKPACECGSKLGVPVFRFLKEPLIRQFGQEWYDEAELVFEALKYPPSTEDV
ncbi:MAG: hypothetical protein RL106_1245 [Bacteroidota bacterium]|jgi:hypothetical protein